MKAAYLDPERGVTKAVNIDLDDMFRKQIRALIRCDYLTTSTGATDHISYIIWSDDCALLKTPPRPYSVTGLGIAIPGPCVILGDDGGSDVRGLSSLELKRFGCDGSGDGTATMMCRNWYTDKAYSTATDAEKWLKKYLEGH